MSLSNKTEHESDIHYTEMSEHPYKQKAKLYKSDKKLKLREKKTHNI